jgi:large subunit ribosomal protein L9
VARRAIQDPGGEVKVILKRDVKGLGREGDLKDVKDGYARNHLIPTGAAVLADLGAVRNWERHREQRDDRDRALRADAEALAERLNALTVQIGVKAGERDRLFGSVTTRDIADRLRQEGIEVDRHDIHLREPIKTVGEHQVRVHVTAGVESQLRVEVVPEH